MGYQMCRESRILLNELTELASQHNITKLVVPSEIMMADFLCLKFYTNPMVNIIKQKIKKIKKLQYKHFTPDYYLPILCNYAMTNSSIARSDYAIGLPPDINIFKIISEYLLVDYSIKDAYKVYVMCTQHTFGIVRSAIMSAINMNVHNIQYVQTIIDKINAEKKLKRNNIQSIIEKENLTNDKLNQRKIVYDENDIEKLNKQWTDTIQNNEIEKMFNDRYGV